MYVDVGDYIDDDDELGDDNTDADNVDGGFLGNGHADDDGIVHDVGEIGDDPADVDDDVDDGGEWSW